MVLRFDGHSNHTMRCATNASLCFTRSDCYGARFRLPFISSGPSVLTQIQRVQIEGALLQKGAFRPCSRCDHKEFAVLDTVFTNSPGPLLAQASVQRFPAIGVACSNCGALYYHLLGTLVPSLEQFFRGRY